MDVACPHRENIEPCIADGHGRVALSRLQNHLRARKRAISAVSTQSSRSSADQTTPDFGPNEWLVDELYQKYLEDPNSVDRAWWNFFADYQPDRPAKATDGAAASPPTP